MVGSSGRRLLKRRDRWFFGIDRWLKALAISPFVRQRLLPFISMPKQEDLNTLRELMEAGKVTPMIGARYPLSKVPEALRQFEQGHAQGKTVITV